MTLSRTRPGELVAALSAVALLALLFLDWARPETSVLRDPGAQVPAPLEDEARGQVGAFVDRLAESGWATLGWVLVALLVLTAFAALTTFVLSVSERAPAATPVAAEVITTGLGILTLLVLLVRLLLAQPGLDAGFADSEVDVLAPAWFGLLALFGLTAGAWYAMADERTDAPYSVPPEIPVRPAPSGEDADPVPTPHGG